MGLTIYKKSQGLQVNNMYKKFYHNLPKLYHNPNNLEFQCELWLQNKRA